jgi:hypothetical protein
VSVALAAPLMCLGMVGAASAANAGGQSALAAARAGTAAYHDIANVPASYADSGLPCFETAAGGMGIHYLDVGALMDPTEDPAHPEALVYAQTADGLKLVAVEYIVPTALVDPDNPPSLFGQAFTAETIPGAGDLTVLHAWIWDHNPAGMFKDWNPSLDSCR